MARHPYCLRLVLLTCWIGVAFSSVAVQRTVFSNGGTQQAVIHGLRRASNIVILGCADPWWQSVELSTQDAVVACIDSDCAALQRAEEAAVGTVRQQWLWQCMNQTSERAPATLSRRRQRPIACRGEGCAVAFLHKRDAQLPSSILVGLATCVSQARWVVEIKPASDMPQTPAEVSILDRATMHQQILVPSHNSFNQVFSQIYTKKVWGEGGLGSGDGSRLEQTASLRAELPKLLQEYGVKSMLDSSCGGMLWMPLVLKETEQLIPGFKFRGQDVVCALIDGHKANFTNHANWEFACSDASNEPMPFGWDLIFSRDSFQHLPLLSLYRFLHNVKASGARYLAIGSYLKGNSVVPAGNRNIAAGDYFALNVLQPPFNLRPAPVKVFEETTTPSNERKFLLLFEVNALQWDEQMDLGQK